MMPDVRARWAAVVSTGGEMTADELMALPEHRWRYELIKGRLTLRLPSDLCYDMTTRLLVSALGSAVRAAGIEGTVVQEAGVVLSMEGQPDTLLVPALAFVRAHQAHLADSPVELSPIRLVPEFVSEIAAPGQARQALAERARIWLGAGTSVVWIIWPALRQVEVWRARGDVSASAEPDIAEVTIRNVHNVLELPDLVPGFSYPVGHLFN